MKALRSSPQCFFPRPKIKRKVKRFNCWKGKRQWEIDSLCPIFPWKSKSSLWDVNRVNEQQGNLFEDLWWLPHTSVRQDEYSLVEALSLSVITTTEQKTQITFTYLSMGSSVRFQCTESVESVQQNKFVYRTVEFPSTSQGGAAAFTNIPNSA